jgi:branched-chain amino acid transport system ATP-binding protein
MDALLSLRDVHTRIAGSHVLQGVTFDVTRAQTTVLLGRNGAGKSTTLRTILGLWQAESGSIMLDGKELTSRPAHKIAREGIGFVPEDREVFSALTVEENLRLAQRKRTGSSEKADKSRVDAPGKGSPLSPADQTFAMFPDLRAARNRSAGALSGGQQQMLAIGRALVNSNRILLVDEPTKGLAPVIVQQLAQTFRSLREQGQTVLLVEQNLEFARAVGDRYFIVDEGRIVHGGAMPELGNQPELLRRYIGV